MPRQLALLASFVLAACGDDGGASGPADAPFVPVDIDNGSCGDQVRFTGEYIDWDSEASFCGINEALFEVEGDGAMDSTSPNGRFDLCIPDVPTTRLVITQPAAMSACTTPPAAYTVGAIAIAHRDVIRAGGFWSGRAFTSARQATLFQELGVAFDPTKAQVLVHVEGMATRAVSLAATHGPAQAITGTAWAPGATGRDVFFPNVERRRGHDDGDGRRRRDRGRSDPAGRGHDHQRLGARELTPGARARGSGQDLERAREQLRVLVRVVRAEQIDVVVARAELAERRDRRAACARDPSAVARSNAANPSGTRPPSTAV